MCAMYRMTHKSFDCWHKFLDTIIAVTCTLHIDRSAEKRMLMQFQNIHGEWNYSVPFVCGKTMSLSPEHTRSNGCGFWLRRGFSRCDGTHHEYMYLIYLGCPEQLSQSRSSEHWTHNRHIKTKVTGAMAINVSRGIKFNINKLFSVPILRLIISSNCCTRRPLHAIDQERPS